LGRTCALFRYSEEIGDLDLKDAGKAVQNVHGGILLPPLQTAEVRAIHPRIIGESLLRKTLADPDSPEVPSK
jgi:hypothetical protein